MELIRINVYAQRNGIDAKRLTALCRQKKIAGAVKDGRYWLIPDNTLIPEDGRGVRSQRDCIQNTGSGYIPSAAGCRAAEEFRKIYGHDPNGTAFTPYRICPVGAHVDHNLGRITGFAIDKGVHIAYCADASGVIEIQSLQFPGYAQWHVSKTPEKKQNDWADHLRGAVIALSSRYPIETGMHAVIDGELPVGGLSSSAAVIITFLSVLCTLNNISLSESEMITISKEAENNYVGVSCGKLDQSCEVYCRKDKLLYLDTKDDSYELIPTSPVMKPYEIAIFFSGLERSLASSKYNMRADELRSAAYALKAFAGMEYGKFNDTYLRDVPEEIFEEYKDRLPENWRKRAEHWYSENRRVINAAECWRNGDIEGFGKIVFESGRSSIELWETGSSELIKLYQIMTETKGIYGGRFSGAGFKGCCMALINPEYRESILDEVEKKYLEAFPELEGKYSAHICHSGDGVKL